MKPARTDATDRALETVPDNDYDDSADTDAPAPVLPSQRVAERSAPPAPAPPRLDDRERQILTFERKWWRHAGAKEQAIRETFDMSATRYYQLLNTLLENPAALAAEPMLIGRLRRLRSTRARPRGN